MEKHGRKDYIEAVVKVNSLIPTIYIKSSIQNYEKIKFSGKYDLQNYNGLLGTKLEINNRTVFLLMSNLTMSKNYKDFTAVVNIQSDWFTDIKIHFKYLLGTPNKFNLKVMYKGIEFEVLAGIYTPELAFSFQFQSNFPGFEEFTLSGQFGATAIRSLYSYKNYRIKREAFLKTEDKFHILIHAPNSRFKRFAIRNDQEYKFAFEIEGNNDFAFGAEYDLSNLTKAGRIELKLIYPDFKINYSLLASYNLPASDVTKGLNSKIYLKKEGNDWFSGKLTRTLGRTYAEIVTPLNGWKFIKLEMLSDWRTYADIHFEREARITDIHLEQHGLYDYNIIFKTPFEGYRNIQIKSMRDKNTIVIQAIKENTIISEISLQVNTVNLEKAMGSISVKWDAGKDLFVHVNTSFDGIKAILSISTSFEQVRSFLFEVGVKKHGLERNSKALLKLNDKFLKYESHFQWTDTELVSNSKVETNFEYLQFNFSETYLKLQFSKDLTSFFDLTMETKTDNVVTFNTKSTLKLDFKGTEIKILYKGEFPVLLGKIQAKLHLDSTLKTKIEVKGNWEKSHFHVRLLLTAHNAEARFDSNLDGYEKLVGSALWTINEGDNSNYGIDVNLENCHDKVCSPALKFKSSTDSKPFSKLSMQFLVPGILNETLKIDYLESKKTYHIVADYIGFKIYHLNATMNLSKRSVNILIHNKSDGRKWYLKTNAEFNLLQSGSIMINMQLIVNTPFTEDFKTIVILDIENEPKHFELTFKYGIIDASLKTRFLWSLEKSDILFQIRCPRIGIKKVKLLARRKQFEHIKYFIDYNGSSWELESKVMAEGNKVNLLLSLKTPIIKYSENKMNIQVIRGEFQDIGQISLIFGGSGFEGKFSRKNFDMDIQVNSLLTGLEAFRFTSEIENCKKYNIDIEVNGKKIKITNLIDCSSYEMIINVETDYSVFKSLSAKLIPQENANLELSLEFHGLALDFELVGHIISLEKSKLFIWDVVFDEQKLNANLSYTIETHLKNINMLYSWSNKSIEIISSLDTNIIKRPHFLLTFKSPYKNIEEVKFEAYLGDRNSKLEGKLFVMFSDKILQIELGSVGNHLYLEAKTPIEDYEMIKFDINHLSNMVKTRLFLGKSQLRANFNKRRTIYNFDISSDIMEREIKFIGKIDIAEKALQTSVTFDNLKLRMKANTNGESMSASFTSKFDKKRNIKLKGNWKWIKNGFSVIATADFLNHLKHSSNEFHAKFESNNVTTHGYWKVITPTEEILFNMKIDKNDPDSMNIFLSIELPNISPIFCQINYFDQEKLVGGSLEFTNPWKYVNISFSGGFKSDTQFEFRSIVVCQEEIFNLEVIVEVSDIDDIAFKIKCRIPAYDKDFGSTFMFKPHSLYNFKFVTILTINDRKFGGGASVHIEESSADITLSIFTPVINSEYKFGGSYDFLIPKFTIHGYFNSAVIDVTYDIVTGSLIAACDINVRNFISAIFGDQISDSIMLKNIRAVIEYSQKEHGRIIFQSDKFMKFDMGFTYKNSRITGNIDFIFPSYNISKAGFISFDIMKNGIFEVFIKENNESMNLSIATNNKIRKVRAVVEDQEGVQEFSFFSKLNQAVFMLMTKNGIHKISYDVKITEKVEVNIQVESPYLNNGFASASISVNQKKNIYEGRFSVNNDHFVFTSFKLNNMNLESLLSIESKDLEDKFIMTFSYLFHNNKFSLFSEISFFSSHKIELEIDIKQYIFKSTVNSYFIPYNHVSLDISLEEGEKKNFSLLFSYGEQNMEIEGSLQLQNGFEFRVGFLSSEFSKLKFNAEILLQHINNFKLKIDVDTAFPQFSKALLIIEEISDLEQSPKFRGLIILPWTNYETFDTTVELVRNSSECTLKFRLLTPHGIYISTIELSIYEKGAEMKWKMNGPFNTCYYGLANIDWETKIKAYADILLPILGEVALTFETESLDIWKNGGLLHLQWIQNEVNIRANYDFDSFLFSANIDSTVAIISRHGISFGYLNSERKLFFAHLQYYETDVGVKLHYNFNQLSDMDVLAVIDLPFENWNNIKIHVSVKMSEENLELILDTALAKNKAKALVIFNENLKAITVQLFGYKIDFDSNGVEDTKLLISIPSFHSLLQVNSKLLKGKHVLSKLQFKMNQIERIVLIKNEILGSYSAKIYDVIFPHYIEFDLNKDLIHSDKAIGLRIHATKISSSTIEETIHFEISARNYVDAHLSIKIPHLNIIRINAAFHNTIFTNYSEVKLISGETILVHTKKLKSSHDSFDHKLSRVKTSSYCLELKSYNDQKVDASNNLLSLQWGMDDCSMQLAYLQKNRKWNNFVMEEKYIVYPENKEFNVFGLNKRKETGKETIELIFDHHDDKEKYTLKFVPKYIETMQNLEIGLNIGYSISTEPFRYLNFDLLIPIGARKIQLDLRFNGNFYQNKVHNFLIN